MIQVGPTDYVTQNWVVVRVDRQVQLPRRPQFMVVLSGVAHLNMKGGNGKFARDTARLTLQPSLLAAIEHAIVEGGIVRPPNSTPVFRVSQWAFMGTVSSSFNKNTSVNSGFAVDNWEHSPFDTITSIPGNVQLNRIFTGIDFEVGVSDIDAIFYRLGYHATLLATVAFKAPPLPEG